MAKDPGKRDESGKVKKDIDDDERRINRLNKEDDMTPEEKLRRAIEEGK